MKRIIPVFAAALLCVGLTACEGRSNKGFTEVETSAAESSAAEKTTTTTAKAAETSAQETAEAPAETEAASAETAEAPAEAAAETAPQQETPAPGTPDEPAENDVGEGGGTLEEAMDDAYRTAARSQAQLMLATCDSLLLKRDITGDPIPDGTYTKGDGSAVAGELDGISDIIDYTVVVADGKTVSATVVTQGDNGTIEETVTA